MTRCKRIKAKLAQLNPEYCEIVDESELHSKHISNITLTNSDEPTHIKLILHVNALNDVSLLQRHRYINKLLESEFKLGLHALSIKFINHPLLYNQIVGTDF